MKAHTYIAGEDASRLAERAKEFGLEEARQPKQFFGGMDSHVGDSVSWMTSIMSDDTLAAAVMHSVGIVGTDERIDESGTLHMVTIRRKRSIKSTPPTQLTELFCSNGLFTCPHSQRGNCG